MKVYSTVGVDIQSGKARQAWEWAGQLADYCNKNYPETTVEVLQEVTGSGNRIMWVSKHDSLGESEAFWEWYGADEDFQKIIAEENEQELVDWSSINRAIFRIR